MKSTAGVDQRSPIAGVIPAPTRPLKCKTLRLLAGAFIKSYPLRARVSAQFKGWQSAAMSPFGQERTLHSSRFDLQRHLFNPGDDSKVELLLRQSIDLGLGEISNDRTLLVITFFESL
ncbi:hypothetical protein RAS12_04780 [Achromobacter seleniivolatilans]|uniref:Uncharacterized protein n=1 Tax=Achromobacter seleniivolatilans TaxID=3047478 RepID=A0ABY9M426_9BURK|nr:hypothetical protein [Achromobacter sp. R39]WMD21695.1 hypothetical protein RAS12_04780 [Achromobacter sp. R39]